MPLAPTPGKKAKAAAVPAVAAPVSREKVKAHATMPATSTPEKQGKKPSAAMASPATPATGGTASEGRHLLHSRFRAGQAIPSMADVVLAENSSLCTVVGSRSQVWLFCVRILKIKHLRCRCTKRHSSWSLNSVADQGRTHYGQVIALGNANEHVSDRYSCYFGVSKRAQQLLEGKWANEDGSYRLSGLTCDHLCIFFPRRKWML